jgi:ATP-dependent DNA helicase RecQ
VEVLKGGRAVTLYVWPERKPKRTRREARADLDAALGESLPVDRALFDQLRSLRRQLAHERGLPPYLIFNDRTLAEMSARKPRTSEEFRRIKGVGDKKAADLGPIFLARIAELAPA